MPRDSRIKNIQAFLHSAPIGPANFHCAEEVLIGIAESHGGTNQNILLDLQDVQTTFRLYDHQIRNLVEVVMKKFPQTFRNKMGVVDRDPRNRDGEEFFVHCANKEGFQVKLFVSTSRALSWFSEPLEPAL